MAPRIIRPEQLKELLGIPFTAEQLACATAPLAPAVIVAGAGSGKTTVMAARVVWLVGTGQVAPEQVLGLTFTNKAAGELAERVRRALAQAGVGGGAHGTDRDTAAGATGAGAVGRDAHADPYAQADPYPFAEPDAAGDADISTYHAFAGRLLKDHGMRIGLEPGARLLADATRFQLAAKVLRSAPGRYPALTKGLPALVGDLLALSGELSEHLVTPERLAAHDAELAARLAAIDPAARGNAWVRAASAAVAARRDLAGLAAAYRAEKQRRDLIDFGDQIALSAALVQARPEVGAMLRAQYTVVLLDEYQDTSVAQRLLLAGLFGGGTGHAVTAVGDPCQAIYGWRGASVANLDDFPRHFPQSGGAPAARYSLSENRRSGGRLLDLANTLAAELRARHEGVQALRPAPGAERDGTVRCALLPTQAEETAWLADTLAHLVRTGTPPGEIAVLCRTAAQFPDLHAALVARDVPVEVVGLSGLLHLPEVADLVATCEVLHDPTANAALVRLLAGPRWRIGPRDLALLGRRARLLVRRAPAADPHGAGGTQDGPDALAAAVEGVDPAELVSLADAMETFVDADPGDGLPFSPEARVRFARFATEIRDLRRSLADPLMDVLHRVLTATGLDVELSASPHALAARRRETLHAFLDVAAGFAALDGEATLLAFLGFLRTAAEYEKGLDSSLPGGENTVKVLTAHKSKGLEWDVVAVPGLVARGFPSERGRELWTSSARVLPHRLRGDAATLPDVEEWTRDGLEDFRGAMKEHQRVEELRLGYVTFTRPRSLLIGAGHWWGPTQKTPFGPSAFLDALRVHCEAGYGEVEHWAEQPAPGDVNPALAESAEPPWPLPLDQAALRRRRDAADTVLAYAKTARAAAAGAGDDGDRVPVARTVVEDVDDVNDGGDTDGDGDGGGASGPLVPEDARLVASWDRDLDALVEELRRARAAVREVPLPASLTATQLMRLAADPDGLARDLARPLPRPPAPAARRGTRFHAWVESRFEARPLFGPEELPGVAPGEGHEIADEQDLAALKEAFLRTPFADRVPFAVEAPFHLVLAGRVVRGRIDAVYRTPPAAGRDASGGRDPGRDPYDGENPYDDRSPYDGENPYDDRSPYDGEDPYDDRIAYELLDWKTGDPAVSPGDPLQLAVYRLAWAEQHGVPLQAVRAGFLYVRTGALVHPPGLPDRAALERLITSGHPAPETPDRPG